MAQLPDDFYGLIDNTTILRLQSRNCFGGDRAIGPDDPKFGDGYNRIWKLRILLGYQNVISTTQPAGSYPNVENDPPPAVMENPITPPNASDSITMLVPLPNDYGTLYFVFYFNEPQQDAPVNHTRKFHIYINGDQRTMVDVPQNGTSRVVSLYPLNINPLNISGDYAYLKLEPIEGSTFPPILNAMEVFTMFQWTSGGQSYYCSSMVLAVLHVFGILILFG